MSCLLAPPAAEATPVPAVAANGSEWMGNLRTSSLADLRPGPGLAPLVPDPPPWAETLAAGSGGAPLDRWRLVSARIPAATTLDAPALERAVADAYAAIASSLAASGHHPVRFWNFVPAIHGDMADGRDRYMVFNAGRFEAFREWFGSEAVFNRTLPTASAVGIVADPLVIHALASTQAGTPVENPRQIPAYNYSKRYGPLPPCFARGTVVRDAPRAGGTALLVGGTASIVGEHSTHERDARHQILETFENLSRLVAAAGGAADVQAALDAFRFLRVYVVRPDDADQVQEMVRDRFTGVETVEFGQADLCRRELLVEIEGLVELSRPSPA